MMDKASPRLPRIKPRFFLRRWVDRLALDCIRRAGGRLITPVNFKWLGWLPLVLYMLSPTLLVGTCLVGIFYPSEWLVLGLLAAVLAWPVRWAIAPWVKTFDEDRVRALIPGEYQLIEDFSSPLYLEDIVAWASEYPYFDTRHLVACMKSSRLEDIETAPWTAPFTGTNALDLFGGLVGRRVAAIEQGVQLEANTPRVDSTVASVRRF